MALLGLLLRQLPSVSGTEEGEENTELEKAGPRTVAEMGLGAGLGAGAACAWAFSISVAARVPKVASRSPMSLRDRPSSRKRAVVMYSAFFLGYHSLRMRPRSTRKMDARGAWRQFHLACSSGLSAVQLVHPTFAAKLGNIFKQADDDSLVARL